MPTSIRSQALGWFAPALVLVFGCGKSAVESSPAANAAPVVAPVSTEPGQIELFEPRVTLKEGNRIAFEVRYRFTKGKPDKYYMCDVSFPGTTNHAAKPMESWELKAEGIIKDGITLSKPPVQTFEIRVSEANSPQDGYKVISNTVSGLVKE
jgi:hypothetical protein